jgi:glycine C-acetyltransferase
MLSDDTRSVYRHILDEIDAAGLRKDERVIVSPQGADIRVAGGAEVVNFCANNYLGLSSYPEVLTAAHEALETHGYGLSSVRFICGTQDRHKRLEARIA